MDKFKKIVVIVIFSILNFCILINNPLSEENVSSNNDVEVNKMEEMIETLKREREELGKLKSELVDTVRQREDEVKVQKEKELEMKGKVIITNFVNESIENTGNLVGEQGNLPPHNKEVEVNEIIIQENEDEEVEESEKVIINGDEIIHPFEIGENLYKSGEYKAAVDIYKLVLKNDVEKDKKMWITYQIANCYRKLGLYTDAIRVYREMRQVYEGTYWAKQAQWYIQDIEWRSKVEGKLDTVIKR
ncbi:MAG: tetratricopeptide repeat protein [Planctomycetota bacterium]|jgi:pentatricopeptide repeat protein